MSWNRPFCPLLLLAIAAAFLGGSLIAQAPEGDRDKPRPKKPPGEVPGDRNREPELSPEENERLRQALARAWENPEVIRTRESVRQATEEYRKALRKAVREVDPGAVDLMGKLHEKSKSQAIEHRIQPKNKPPKSGPDSPPPPPNAPPEQLVQWVVDNEPGFRPLEPEHRRGLMRLAQETAAKGTVNEEMDLWRHATNPKEAGNARLRLRQKLYDAMAEQDPGFRQLRGSLPEPGAPRPKGPGGEPPRPDNEPRPERPPVEVER